jgi:hypothetical protein
MAVASAISKPSTTLERDAPAIGERDLASRIAHRRGLFAADADDDGARRLCTAVDRERDRRAEEEMRGLHVHGSK